MMDMEYNRTSPFISNCLHYSSEFHPYVGEFLDICIAGIHSFCYSSGTADQNTDAVIGAISNPHIDIISHPGDGTALLNFEPIVLASKEYGTLLEINNSSLNPVRNKSAARRNNLEILRLCKKYEHRRV